MWVFLFLCTVFLELVALLWCFACGVANLAFLGGMFGYDPHTASAQTNAQFDQAAANTGLGHIELVLMIYAVVLLIRLVWPFLDLLRLGARRPTVHEMSQMHLACSMLEVAAFQQRIAFRRPRWWKVLDSPHMNIRYIGLTLVVDRGLIESPFFPPMLAHELAYQHTFDLWGKYIVNLFAPKGCAVGLLLGFGLGLGPLLLWVPWRSYWRNREYAADEFAARIGQRFQLIGALETLFLPFDAATRYGILVRDKPYVALRIDRLRRLII
jgi:hypothetical protein